MNQPKILNTPQISSFLSPASKTAMAITSPCVPRKIVLSLPFVSFVDMGKGEVDKRNDKISLM